MRKNKALLIKQAGNADTSSKSFSKDFEIEYEKYYRKGGLLSADIKLDGLICITKNGKITEKDKFIDGLRDGIYQTYDETGALESEIPFKMGVADGYVKYYYPNGSLKHLISYKKGEKEGDHTVYDVNGKKSLKIAYKDGSLVGGVCYKEREPQGTEEDVAKYVKKYA